MITAQLIAKAKPGDVLSDPRHRGLRLVIGEKKKTWQYRYRVGEKLKQVVLGHFPALDIVAAQIAWGKAVQGRHDGNDPAMQRKAAKKAADEAARPAVRVCDIVKAYMTEHVERKRTPESARARALHVRRSPAPGDRRQGRRGDRRACRHAPAA